MSLAGFQQALAMLIRLPEKHRKQDEIESFLESFDLEPEEELRIRGLARDRNVVRYGRSMASVRRQSLDKHLTISHRFLPAEAINHLWHDLYEPTAPHLLFPRLVTAFYDFVLENPEARSFLKETAPVFIFDVLKLERADARLRHERLGDTRPLPAGSRLKHRAFVFEKLEHDIPDMLQRNASVPSAREVTVLFLMGARDRSRYYEVDDATRAIVEGQEAGLPLPVGSESSTKALAAIGLF